MQASECRTFEFSLQDFNLLVSMQRCEKLGGNFGHCS